MASTTTKTTTTVGLVAALAAGALLLPNPNTVHLTWINPTTRVNGVPLPRNELRGVRLYVDGKQVVSIGGTRVDLQTYDLTLKCYKPGRTITITAVDTNGLESPQSKPITLQPKTGTTCL